MGSRRSAVNFAFGNFDIESGFAVSHQYDRTPGIARPGDPITLRVATVPEYASLDAYVLEGLGPYPSERIRAEGRQIPFYRSGDGWIATLPGMEDRTTFHYVVEAAHRSGAAHYADGRLPLERARVFTQRVTTRRPPEWTSDAVVYQIFVDRFADENGTVEMPEDDHDFAGGNLHGVVNALDWLHDLGVNCIWLTPVFTCTSYHGYDTVDFLSIDPRFGGDDALRELVDEAHRREMRVLLDFVPNHISVDHPWFRSARRGGPERDWFFIEDDGSYQMFFSSATMPKVNLDHPEAREAMIDVATHWVREFGIDGYRIDHALGPTESFFAALTDRIERLDPDVWMFGEVTATPQLCRRYGGVLDGVTDFPFAYAMRALLAGDLDPADFAEIEREATAVFPTDAFSWVRFFDNHDMARAIHGWDGEDDTLARALGMLFSLPGVPSIFYGTEQALSHEHGEDVGGLAVGRVPMAFDRSHPLFAATRDAISRWSASSNTPSTPLYWSPDGTKWHWGDLGGQLPEAPDSRLQTPG